MKYRRSKHGFSLVEVLVAMAVLSIGGLATLRLVGLLISSNSNMSATTDATALATRLVAEIGNAQFVDQANQDPHLAINTYDAATVRNTASSITTFGNFTPGGLNAVAAGQNPVYTVTYEVVACDVAICGSPTAVPPAPRGGGVEIMVTVSNFSISGPMLRPIRFVLRKEYTASSATGAAIRGY